MKKVTTGLLFLSMVGFLASYFILGMDLVPSAKGDMLVKLGKSLFYGMSALSAVFITLLFVPQAFNAWKKFAVWFVPAATLLFVAYQDPGSGDFISPDPEQVYLWVSALYVILSYVIIFRNRKS